MFRYLERRFGRGKKELMSEFYEPTATLRTACIYIVAYSQLRVALGVKRARLLVIGFHVVWKLMEEFLQKKLDLSSPLAFAF